MAQFPLALSIEPRLLPLAIANGFRMDSRVRMYYFSSYDLTLIKEMLVQYRDFVFRRIFVRSQEHGVEDVLLNVRELCRLDASYVPLASGLLWAHSMLRRMFVSRTVAAEVLMEAESNRAGYAALKTLDREGGLRFSLAYVSSLLVGDIIEHSVSVPWWKTLSR
jgi:hypothetical protein